MNIQRNIHLIALIRVLMVSGAIVVPGLPPLLQANGMTIWEMEMWFAAALLGTLLPSGILADRYGERRVMLLGSSLMVLGQVCYTFANTYLLFALAEILIGAGLGCIFGSDESLLHKALARLSAQELATTDVVQNTALRFSRSWNRTVVLQVVVVSLCFLLGEYAAAVHERLPFLLSLSGYLGLTLAIYRLDTIPAEAGQKATQLQWGTIFRTLQQQPALLHAIGTYAFFVAALRTMFWGYYDVFQAAGSHLSVGAALAIGSIIAGISAMKANAIRQHLSQTSLVTLVGVGIGCSLVLMGIVLSPWCFLWVFFHQLLRGQVLTSFSVELHQLLEGEARELRASLASVREMAYLVVYLLMMHAAHSASTSYSAGSIFLGLGVVTLLVTASFMFVGISRGKTSLQIKPSRS